MTCAEKFNVYLTNMWIDLGFMDVVSSRIQAKDLKEMNYHGTRKRYFRPLLKLTTIDIGEGRPARAERELLDMECLSYTDTSTLLAMMDCMAQNLSTTQTFQYIGDFVLYIMEVRYMLYPDELAS